MKLKSVVATALFAAASWNASAAVYDLGTLDPSGFDTSSLFSSKFAANAAINDTWNFTLVEPSSTSFAALQTFAVTAGQIMNFSAVLSGTNLTQTFGAGSQTLSWTGGLPLAATASMSPAPPAWPIPSTSPPCRPCRPQCQSQRPMP